MLNLESIDKVYLVCGFTDIGKSIDGLVLEIQNSLKLNPFEKVLFVFCNSQKNRIKILHFYERFWLYYHRIEKNKLKWPMKKEEAVKVNKEELSCLLKGYEVITTSKFKAVTQSNTY